MNRKTRLLRLADPGRLAIYLMALWKLLRHRETPRAARWLAVAVLAYALSPIDLIPDFIPVLGLLDDVILVPLGVALVVRLTPKPLWQGLLREAEASQDRLPHWRWGALLVLIAWAALLGLGVWGLVALRHDAGP